MRAARSVSNAWAAGGSVNGGAVNNSFLLHCNGTAWKQAASPNPWLDNGLSAVAATSAANAWAVGGTSSGATGGSLILHWNGTAWKRVPSP